MQRGTYVWHCICSAVCLDFHRGCFATSPLVTEQWRYHHLSSRWGIGPCSLPFPATSSTAHHPQLHVEVYKICCRCERMCPGRLNQEKRAAEGTVRGKKVTGNLSATFWYGFYHRSEVHLERPNQLERRKLVRAENIFLQLQTSLKPHWPLVWKVQQHYNTWQSHDTTLGMKNSSNISLQFQ